MKQRRWISASLAAALVLGSLAAPAGMADEGDFPDEVISYEEFEVDAEPGIEGGEPVGDPGLEQTPEEDPEVEAEDQESADDVLLIEDAGVEMVSVSDGADYEEVAAAESEADAAAEKVKELLDGVPLQLESADRERIAAWLEKLTAGENPTGSDGELEAAAFIEETMRSFGYTISEQHFHEGFLNEDLVDVPGVNIIAERGADSKDRTREIIIVCAHYDSKTKPDPEDPLANDKSSAVAVMECARILSTVDSNVDLCFLFLSGEEDGYYGSLRIAEGLTEEIKQRIKCVMYVGPVGYVLRDRSALEEAQTEGLSETDSAQGAQAAGTDASAAPQQGGDGDSILDDVNANAGFEITDEDSASIAPEEGSAQETGAQPDRGRKIPCLLSVPTDESNDPADLLQALGLYRRAEEMLAGDLYLQAAGGSAADPYAAADTPAGAGADLAGSAGWPAGTDAREYTQADWERLVSDWEEILAAGHRSLSEDAAGGAAGETAAADTEGPGEGAGQENASPQTGQEGAAQMVTEEVRALALNNLSMLQSLEDWTEVTGSIPYLQNFSDHGMTVTGLFQPVDERLAQTGPVRPLQEAGETGTGGGEEAQTEYPQSSVAASLGAEQADDILLAAGSVSPDEAGEAGQDLAPQPVPVTDINELAEAADFLASAVSLYMRSQTSIELDREQ